MMAAEHGDALEVRLTPEDQMILKYLVRLVLAGVSRDEISLAFEHAFVDVQDREVAALRALVQERTTLGQLDEALRGGRFETLCLSVADGGLIAARRGGGVASQ